MCAAHLQSFLTLTDRKENFFMDLRLQGKSTIKKLFIGIAVLFIVALVYLLRAQKETQVQNTAIYINEVCPANLSVVKNSRKEFPKGWVELYNAGEETVSLKDYCLSDSEKYWRRGSMHLFFWMMIRK